ncbi:MAG TPA: CBS domain-containing protein [Candidatus Limnocylindrales bacterium]
MLTVQDVMTTTVISVHPADPLKDVAQVLVDRQISGVPVVDSDGLVVGVVSEADFLLKEGGPEAAQVGRVRRLVESANARMARRQKLEATTVGELMTSPAVTIGPRRPVAEAARLMRSRGVNRLPVIDGENLVGIVTRADLVRAFARSDEELARAIRDDVLLHTLWLDPTRFTVSVNDGVASVVGDVERRSTAELVRETVALVPGIVDVQTRLSWSLDDREIKPPTRDMVFPRGLR